MGDIIGGGKIIIRMIVLALGWFFVVEEQFARENLLQLKGSTGFLLT